MQAGSGNVVNAIIRNNIIASDTTSGIYAQTTRSTGTVTTSLLENIIFTSDSSTAGIYVTSGGSSDTTFISGNTIQGVNTIYGIFANSLLSATISNNDVLISGSGAVGIYTSGVVTESISSNQVSATGDFSEGIMAFAEGLSSLSILQNTITATGLDGVGLYLEVDTGPANALLSKNILNVSGSGSTGIDVENFDTLCLTLTNNTATAPIVLNNQMGTFTLDTSSDGNTPTPIQTTGSAPTSGTCGP